MTAMTATTAGSACQEQLPETFTVRYLGRAAARGLWGVKHTRGPVDRLVAIAKRDGAAAPVALLTVAPSGCTLQSAAGGAARHYPVDSVSYGVQDLVYTRVFSMIVVRDRDGPTRDADEPFQCHAFVCESRQAARKLTYCLATAFQEYSRSVRGSTAGGGPPTRALIDLTGSGDQDQADSSEA